MTEAKIEKVEHKNIYAALAAFQGELKPMPRNGRVQFETKGGKTVDFTYTPLGDIMSAIYPILAKNGLSIRHELTEKGIEAVLAHETYRELEINSEEKQQKIGTERDPRELVSETTRDIVTTRIENEIRSGTVKVSQGGEMKDVGAAITYARRYTMTMVLGISSEEDKDADLLEQSAKNAIQYAYGRAKKGLEEAKTVKELEKALKVLQSDADALGKGKAPALGLSEGQYAELITFGNSRKKALTEDAGEPVVTPEE